LKKKNESLQVPFSHGAQSEVSVMLVASSQLTPVKPSLQLQAKGETELSQVPFTHGSQTEPSSMMATSSQSGPDQPGWQAQVYAIGKKTSLVQVLPFWHVFPFWQPSMS
jgi:hypothetical protein